MNAALIDLPDLSERFALTDDTETIEVLAVFFTSLDNLLAGLRAALVKQDASEVLHIAHSAKGAAQNASARQLAALFDVLEELAPAGQWTQIKETMTTITETVAAMHRLADGLG